MDGQNILGLSGIQEFLRKLASQGDHDSSGRFTLDLSRAREKLGGYRMARADRFLVAILLGALQTGARKFALRAGFGSLHLEWDGPPLETEARTSQRLWNSSQPGVATLLLGLQTALTLLVRKAHWQSSPDHSWTFLRGGETWTSRAFHGKLSHHLTLWLNLGLIDRLWHRIHAIPSPAEVQWSKEAGLAGSWAEIRWNDQPLKQHLEVSRTKPFCFPGVAEELQLPVHFQRPPINSPPLDEVAGFAYFSAGSRRPTRICWHLFGLAFGEQKLHGFLPGLVVHLNSLSLEPDLSLSQLVDRPPRQQVLLKVMEQLMTLLEENPGWPTPGYLYFSSSTVPPGYLQPLFIARLLPLLAREWPNEASAVIRQQLMAFLSSCEGEVNLEMWTHFPLLSCWDENGRMDHVSVATVRQQAARWEVVYLRNARFRDREPLPHSQMPPVLRLPSEAQSAVQRWVGLPLQTCPDSPHECWHQLQGAQGFLKVMWRRGYRFVTEVPAARADGEGNWQPCPDHYPPGIRILETTTADDILELYPELWTSGEGEHLREHVLPYLAMLAEVGARYPTTLPPDELRRWGFDDLRGELHHSGAILDRPGRFHPWQRKALEAYFGPLHLVTPDVERPEWALEFALDWRRTHCRLGLPADLSAPDHLLKGELLLGLKAQPNAILTELGFGPLELQGESQDLRPADLLRQTPLFRQFLQRVREQARDFLVNASETLAERPVREQQPLQRALWSLLLYQLQEEVSWEQLPLARIPVFQSGDAAWRDLRYVEYLRAHRRLKIWSQEVVPPGTREDCWLVPPRWIFLAHRLLTALESRARGSSSPANLVNVVFDGPLPPR